MILLVASIIITGLFLIVYGFIKMVKYKKKQELGVKGFIVSSVLSFNLIFILIMAIYALQAFRIFNDKQFKINRYAMIVFYILTLALDLIIVIMWLIAPNKLDPNSWSFLQPERRKERASAGTYQYQDPFAHAKNKKIKKEKKVKVQKFQEQAQTGYGFNQGFRSGFQNKKQEKVKPEKGPKLKMPKVKDDKLYKALEIMPNATLEEIKSQYRILVKKYHPDLSTEPDAPERFMQIQKAYEVLQDPIARERYNKTGVYRK